VPKPPQSSFNKYRPQSLKQEWPCKRKKDPRTKPNWFQNAHVVRRCYCQWKRFQFVETSTGVETFCVAVTFTLLDKSKQHVRNCLVNTMHSGITISEWRGRLLKCLKNVTSSRQRRYVITFTNLCVLPARICFHENSTTMMYLPPKDRNPILP